MSQEAGTRFYILVILLLFHIFTQTVKAANCPLHEGQMITSVFSPKGIFEKF